MLGKIIIAEIVDIKDEARDIKSFWLKPLEKINPPQPGQFFQVWVPKYEEIPISVSGYENGLIRITVAKRGETTAAMHKMKIGDLLGIKGPLGKPLKLFSNKCYVLIGGGYGVAPLIFAAKKLTEQNSKVIMITGARTKDLLLFVDEAKSINVQVYCSTDDGSYGFKGTTVDLFKKLLPDISCDRIVACGPKEMLIKIAEIAVQKGIPCDILAESMIKCGVGLCGSCELGKSGLLVCKDGPAFDAKIFLNAVLNETKYH